jgi:hypothetical protein
VHHAHVEYGGARVKRDLLAPVDEPALLQEREELVEDAARKVHDRSLVAAPLEDEPLVHKEAADGAARVFPGRGRVDSIGEHRRRERRPREQGGGVNTRDLDAVLVQVGLGPRNDVRVGHRGWMQEGGGGRETTRTE